MASTPKFCSRECPKKGSCRYQQYLEHSKDDEMFIQICNHNYLLANGYHRLQDYRPLLKDYCALIVDEAHKLPDAAKQMLWSRGMGAILTSGTLKIRQDFSHIRKMTGLQKVQRVREYVADSPFEYQRNCLLYLPKDLKKCRRGSQEEAEMIADHIQSLICSTYGHTLVLFTSYHLKGNVYQMLRDEIPFPMIEVWRHSTEEITRFKQTDNAVPYPISEAQKKEYDCLKDYIQAVVVPDMQKKLCINDVRGRGRLFGVTSFCPGVHFLVESFLRKRHILVCRKYI